MANRIIYTGTFRFPDGDAAAARVVGIGKSLRAMGYEVEYAGWEHSDDLADDNPRPPRSFQGFQFQSMGDLRHGHLPPGQRLLRFLTSGSRTLNWLKRKDLNGVKAIIAYQCGVHFLTRLAHFCKERGIRLIFDNTEWYDPSTLIGGRFGPAAADSELTMRVVNPAIAKGIVISSYLRDYYRRRNCEVVMIPPTVDLEEEKWKNLCHPNYPAGSPLRIAYAGTPARKDLLVNAMVGLERLRARGCPVEFDLIGPSRDEISRMLAPYPGLFSRVSSGIITPGRIPHSEVPSRVSKAHFSILVRPDKRYAHAGFSTKLVESLACGVPVIATSTGDIPRIITHGVNGFLIRDTSVESFMAAIEASLGLQPDFYQRMRRAARLSAEFQFDYRAYIHDDSLYRLLEK